LNEEAAEGDEGQEQGEWRMANGEWRMSEWRMANERIYESANQQIS